ncbi:hypothetical protein B0H10DRAFT_259003 [Mycena sp. CBHHK59/15]|nr:hypothetical protein B0H10DRAFT_259003 [Mycena sp. CBHHK59/15]
MISLPRRVCCRCAASRVEPIDRRCILPFFFTSLFIVFSFFTLASLGRCCYLLLRPTSRQFFSSIFLSLFVCSGLSSFALRICHDPGTPRD